MNLILFGFKGCGKTHFGKKLATEMDRPFIDSDDLMITLYFQKTKECLNISKLYHALGASGFRSLEKEAISTLEKIKSSVIALGGGAIFDPDNLERLEKLGSLVYLKANPNDLRRRIQESIDRGEPPAFFDSKQWENSFWHMIQERTPLYEAISARSVDTNAWDEAGVVAALYSIWILEK